MQLLIMDKGELPLKGSRDREFVWFIVVKGRCDMLVRSEQTGKQYPLRVFEEGETFAHSVSASYPVTHNKVLVRSERLKNCMRTSVLRRGGLYTDPVTSALSSTRARESFLSSKFQKLYVL